MNFTTVWAVQCQNLEDKDFLDQLKARLVRSETQRVLRFRKSSDAVRFALGRALLRSLIISKGANKQFSQKAAWQDIVIEEDISGGKPYLSNNAKAHLGHVADFNISHDGEWVVAGVTPNEPVGVDVAHVYCPENMSDVEYISEFNLQLSSEEKEYLYKHSQQKLADFYRIWTAKEAYTKALGTGVASIDLASISVHLPPINGCLYVSANWQVTHLLQVATGTLDEGRYVYAVAKHPSLPLEFRIANIGDITLD
ncbi:hypothetical protein GGI25_002161 [Coemansia spiralis]|uniref:holo-[acyl-carrier-protein] synthase n=2 Tax=Coemansia TaxID=4863 RepID=A0A9W8G8Q8_9FUNG|nr:hypothetical protein EDC05_000060 [Coemansia umbellata]KAJ2626073.1 hypothetical protein GGI26_000157 [Coemansia sp. RSA 1358]KAJ2678573.1 hypothetical protein GGI25_002161 [Coemansia spiralis]